MTEQESGRRRFSRIRDVSDGVVDAAKSVTGHSAVEDIAEFTDAYTEVLTGLSEDVQALRHATSAIETDVQGLSDSRRAEISEFKHAVRWLGALAILGIAVGIAALVLAVLK